MDRIQINKNKVLTALQEQLTQNESVVTDPESLIREISEETGVQIYECRIIILGIAGSAILLEKATANKEQETVK